MLRRLTLPDGLEVFSLNADETRFVHLEVFVARCYLQHGMVLQDGDCVFDVGANIGLATVFFHRERRNVRIFAFEPSPAACECLRGNIEIHGADAAPVASLSGRYSVLGLGGWNPRFLPRHTDVCGLHAVPGRLERGVDARSRSPVPHL